MGALNSYAFHRLALPQILMTWDKMASAIQQLAILAHEAQATGHGMMLIKALVLQALAYQAEGNYRQALTTLEQALTLAAPEGYVRAFVDAGEPMHRLLRSLRQATADVGLASYMEKLLAVFDGVGDPSVNRTATTVQTALGRAHKIQNLIEPLSDRELEILHLVADGLSNSEVSDKIIVTVGTVKKHLNNIYGKLGVISRTQAIAKARTLNLL